MASAEALSARPDGAAVGRPDADAVAQDPPRANAAAWGPPAADAAASGPPGAEAAAWEPQPAEAAASGPPGSEAAALNPQRAEAATKSRPGTGIVASGPRSARAAAPSPQREGAVASNPARAQAVAGSAPAGEAVVRIDGLVKRYGRRSTRPPAVAGVSLSIARGELYGLIGADGAGKSSLFKAVAGVLSFEGGTLSVFGQRIASERDAERVKQRLGFMPQGLGLNLYPELSVEENIDFFAELRGVPRAELAERKAGLLAMTRLQPFRARPMKQLSGGMKQKLGLVCTLIHAPELIVLDEPTTGVDPLSRRDFWRLLPVLMRERQMTALVSTAYLDEADRFDRVGLMYGGRLVAEGVPGLLAAQLAATVVTVADAHPAALRRLAQSFGAVDRQGASAAVLVPTRDTDEARSRVTAALAAGTDVDAEADADADGPPHADADADAGVGVGRVNADAGAAPGRLGAGLTTRAPELEDLFVARMRESAASHAPTKAQTHKQAPEQTPSQAPEQTPLGDGAAGDGRPAQSPPGPAPPQPAHITGGTGGLRRGALPPTGTALTSTDCAIEAVDLTRDFDHFRAADRVSFRVAQGEIFGLLGANGAGKTTVIKMLTGILPPSSGMGQVAGADMRRAPRAIRQRIGYVSQAFSLYADLSVRDNLVLYAGIYGLGGRAAAQRVGWGVELAGLGEHLDDTAGSLPMGVRQRLALACALLHRPQVLFLDEPTSGVDPLGRRQLWNILSWLSREERVAILLTTHHMAEAERCDHLVLLYDGRVVADATPSAMKRALQQQAGDLVELRCSAPQEALQALRQAGHADAELHGHAIRLMLHDAPAAEARLQAVLAGQGVALEGLQTRELDMEEVFVRRVGALQAAPAP